MNFRQLREQAQVTQYRLAKLTGVEQTTISQIELGKVRDPRYSTIAALADGLHVTPGVVAKAIRETHKHRAKVA
ncbi:MAG TPA: helix-turn-helix transcriptional regulator [Burkholderiales bacterium]|nr:helix-turn-helix transcriptional regulator [Burkholderiales bacterium]